LGTPELEKNLDRNGIINHNQFYLIALPQLNVSNTRIFLMHRLTQAGFRDASPFSDKDITNIFNMANGNPVATMEYAAECLNNNKSLVDESYSEGTKATKPLLIIGAILFIAAILYNSVFMSADKQLDIAPQTQTNIEPPNTDKRAIDKKAVDQLFNAGTNTMDVKQKESGEVLPKLTSKYSLPAYSNQTTTPLNAESLDTAQTNVEMVPQDSSTLLQEKALEKSIKTTSSQAAEPNPIPTLVKQPKSTQPTVTAKAPIKDIKQAVIKPIIAKVDKINPAFIKAKSRSSDWLLKPPSNN